MPTTERIVKITIAANQFISTPDPIISAFLLKLAAPKLPFSRSVIKRDAKKLAGEGIRIIIMGEQDGLPGDIAEDGRKLVEESASNTKGTLIICFNYGGMHEIAGAVKKIIKKDIAEEDVTPELIAENLYFPDVPQIDLLIRTSGEQRISNFMLWRVAYAELYFAKKHWPDFSVEDLDIALADFANRNRRFGGN